jgi:succinate dehydrogenase/fumarate reductase flavoprotein subunit
MKRSAPARSGSGGTATLSPAEKESVDVLVIGSGAAGLRAAIAARQRGASALLLTKGTAGLGTATVLSFGAFTSAGFGLTTEEHVRKTIETGHRRSNPSLVKILAEEAPARIGELMAHGSRFSHTRFGAVAEGRFPIVGRPITETLLAWALGVGVRIRDWITATTLVTDGSSSRVAGCLGVTARGEAVLIRAKAVILCTGGASALFRYHDNPVTNIGDGYAMAANCGAAVADMEFTQFYPLLISAGDLPKILAPPALVERGKVVNILGEDVREKYGLAGVKSVAVKGRDSLSVAVYRERIQGREVFLDLRQVGGDIAAPGSVREMLRVLQGRYQSASRLLPVTPCAHFTMGGVVIDEHCRTSRQGLFAAGEAACGVHGANRLGGNALTETLVFGYRAGEAAAASCAEGASGRRGGTASPDLPEVGREYTAGKHEPAAALRVVRETMWENCGPVRDGEGLSSALKVVEALKREGLTCAGRERLAACWSVWNGLETARMMIKASIARKESIGAHWRTS